MHRTFIVLNASVLDYYIYFVEVDSMNDEPLVSICIPTYNRARTIGRAVNSALNQTYRNIEVLVSDNASEDDTEVLIRNILDPRLHYQKHQQNMGSSYNLRSVVGASTGRYILLLCSDDWVDPCLIEKAVAVLEKNPRIGIYSADYRVVTPDGEVIRKHHRLGRGIRPGLSFNANTILRRNPIGLLTAVFRREAYQECGPWVDHPACDRILWSRMILAGWGVWHDNDVLGSYSVSPDADSINLYLPERVEEFEKYLMAAMDSRDLPKSTWRAAKRGVAALYYSAGRAARNRGDCLVALKLFRRSIELCPAMRWRSFRQLAFIRTYLRMARGSR